eukprot:CAMPEP_0168337026 /NCGR_PEP_ID=MMETSP0213-20121227/11910_1 /TAXON_ID=151035 /ORGANISM="Euplotes harpa, Strain FSP1.4" /LENGTH=48 /DNA_ID= /DNA_START= /DNA_END= /DNA_ORIENTATION=
MMMKKIPPMTTTIMMMKKIPPMTAIGMITQDVVEPLQLPELDEPDLYE